MVELDDLYFLDLNYVLDVNTLEADSSLPCTADLDLTFDNCLQDQVVEKLVEKFGCTVPYMARPENMTNAR